MKKYALIACALATLLYANVSSAQTITLDKTTKLVPIGWSVAVDIKFQKGTPVELTPDSQVISGTLDEDTYLRPTGWRNMINDFYYGAADPAFTPPFFWEPFDDDFGPVPTPGMLIPTYKHARYKEGYPITFASDGTVISGTLDEDITLSLQKGKYGFVNFKGDNQLVFYPNGAVQSATLANDTSLRPVGWQKNTSDFSAGFVTFKGGTQITFTQDGYVSSGTLKDSLIWFNANETSTTLPPKTTVNFTTAGIEVAD